MDYKKRVKNSQKNLIILSKDKKEINTKAKYGPSKPTKIPLYLNTKLAFFIAP